MNKADQNGTKSIIKYNKNHVIKKVNKSPLAIKELNNEIKILKKLKKNDFIYSPKILDYKKNSYIKMSRINGFSLNYILIDIFSKKNNDLKVISEKLANTLSKYYSLGLYHNDLATTNIIYDKNKNEINLIDFGRASYDGNYCNELGYLLDSIIKIKCKGGFFKNLYNIHSKCVFFLDIYSRLKKNNKKKFNFPLKDIIYSYIRFQIFIILKRDFSLIYKIFITPLIFLVPIIIIKVNIVTYFNLND